MTDLESQSQAMRRKELGELEIARDVDDSVFYHSLPEFVSATVHSVRHHDRSTAEFMPDLRWGWLELGPRSFLITKFLDSFRIADDPL